MIVVVSDTSPLNYLVLLHEVDLLPRLFQTVLIPEVVARELSHSGAPPEARAFIGKPPNWLKIQEVPDFRSIPGIDEGEAAAIQLAIRINADVLLIDDAAGRRAAVSRGLHVVGVIGLLERAADLGWIDLESAFRAIVSKTTFRVSPVFLQERFELWQRRRGFRD